jgi:hypothetical protein
VMVRVMERCLSLSYASSSLNLATHEKTQDRSER